MKENGVLKTFISIQIVLAILVTGCATKVTLEKKDKAFGPNAFHDGNTPPSSMSPPRDVASAEARPIDGLHMKTEADYHFTLAEAYSYEGQVDRAIEELKLTLVYDPRSSHVRLRLGAEYIRKGLVSEALEQLEAAVQYEPDYWDARLLLGGLYGSLRMYEKAEEQYNYVMLKQPENTEAPLQMGFLYGEEKKYDEAIGMFKKITTLKTSENPHVGWYYIGRVNQDRKFFKEAEQNFQKALSMKPDFEEAVLGLGKTYEEQSQKEKAFKLYETYQDKHGPNVKVADVLGRMYMDGENYDKALKQFEIIEDADSNNLNVKVKMALILIERKEYSKATLKLKQILAQAPESEKIRFYLGAVYEELKDYDSAIDQFRRIPLGSSFYAESIVHTAYLYKLRGRMDLAVASVEDGIKQIPENEQFYSLYASLLYDLKHYDKAVSMLEGATGKFQNNEQLLFFLGSMYDKVGKKRDTIRVMKSVIEINPQHSPALNYLAYTFAEIGEQLDDAEVFARRALAIKPNDAYIQDTLGWVLYRKGDFKEAVRTLELAYKLKSDESIIAEHLGDAYYRYELPEKAKNMYKRAVELESDLDNAQKIRQKITSIDDRHGPSFNRAPASADAP